MKMKTAVFAFAIPVALAAVSIMKSDRAIADEMIRPLLASEYGTVGQGASDLREMQFVPVAGAQVAWANYAALKRDFPQLKALDNGAIDAWIVRNYAVLSVPQLKLHDVRYRSSTATDMNDARTFLVPSSYGRAAVGIEQNPLVAGHPALIDVKGTGHTNIDKINAQRGRYDLTLQLPEDQRQKALDQLRTHDHSDGLMTLGEAMAEVSRQLAVQASFDLVNAKNQSSHQTVESYFIISLPVQVLKTGDHSDPAAIYGRQTHFSRGVNLVLPTEPTYTDDFGGRQTSFLRTAIDFGGVVIIQPDLQKTFGDPELLKTSQASRADAQLSNAWRYGHEAANGFLNHAGRDYAFARSIINDHFATMLSPLDAKLKSIRPDSADVRLAKYMGARLEYAEPIAAADAHFVSELSRIIANSTDRGIELKALTQHMSFNGFARLHRLLENPKFASRVELKAAIINKAAKALAVYEQPDRLVAMIAKYPEAAKLSPFPAVKAIASYPQANQEAAFKLFFKMTESEQFVVLDEISASVNAAAIDALSSEIAKRAKVSNDLYTSAHQFRGRNARFDALVDVMHALHSVHAPLTCPNVFGPSKP